MNEPTQRNDDPAESAAAAETRLEDKLKAKPHISVSQMEMLSRCGEQYRRRYMEGERKPPGIAAHIGSGVHAGAEVNFNQKIETHADLPVSDIVDAAVAGFEVRYQSDGLMLTDDEASKGVANIVGEAKDQLVQLATCHANEQAPDYQPTEVEHRSRIIFPNATHDLIGFTDLRDDKDRITDFKTAAKKKPKDDADKSIQLTVYSAMFQVDHGRPSTECRFDTVTKTKTPARQVLISHRTQADYVALLARVNATLAVIDAGVFVPASPGDWICNPRWCGYWASCPYVNSERQEKAKDE